MTTKAMYETLLETNPLILQGYHTPIQKGALELKNTGHTGKSNICIDIPRSLSNHFDSLYFRKISLHESFPDFGIVPEYFCSKFVKV